MEENQDFDMYEHSYHTEAKHEAQGLDRNSVMPVMPGSTKNSRNTHIRGAHSEKANKRQRNGFDASDPLSEGTCFTQDLVC